jgi:hypothetical protein
VGSYGTIDNETGEFVTEGNIYHDREFSVEFDHNDEELQPQVQEHGDDELILKSWGVTAKTTKASPEA